MVSLDYATMKAGVRQGTCERSTPFAQSQSNVYTEGVHAALVRMRAVMLRREGVNGLFFRIDARFDACGYARDMRVERRDGETVDQLLRRFNKVVVAERITKTFREKMHFVSESEKRKEKRRRAERNRRKKALQQAQ